ncbi:hypothetical protein D3C80_1488820 [compost metagenome]
MLSFCRPPSIPMYELSENRIATPPITASCTVKVSGVPSRPFRPRVRVDAVSARETVSAPIMVSRKIRSTVRPNGPVALKPVTASMIEARFRPLFLRTWKW